MISSINFLIEEARAVTVTELLGILSFPVYRHVCVRLPDGGYAGGGLVLNVEKRFGNMRVLRTDISGDVFIIYATY